MPPRSASATRSSVQAIVDAGACPMQPTTVIDLSGGEPVLVRPGRGDPALLGLAASKRPDRDRRRGLTRAVAATTVISLCNHPAGPAPRSRAAARSSPHRGACAMDQHSRRRSAPPLRAAASSTSSSALLGLRRGVGLLAARPGPMLAIFVPSRCCSPVLVPRRPLHAAAEPGGAADAVRQLPRHRPRRRPALGESVLREDKISVRAHNFNSEKLKVNDMRGNPIEIAAAIVWRVHDTARARFDVEDYEAYVLTQAEAALRHLASSYAYDNLDDAGATPHARGDAALGHRRSRQGAARRAAGALRAGRASRSSTPSSRTSPTRPRSPARCCAASRPRR